MTYLGDPHGFAVGVPVVVEIFLDSFHAVLVDVQIGHIPVCRDGLLEGSQVGLGGLMTHRR
jgi:hypothetical protein